MAMTQVSDWRDAVPIGGLDEEGFVAATVEQHKLILLRQDGDVVAFRDACPHEGYALSKDGERQGFVLVCNKHLWEFDAATGEHISRMQRPECNLKRYPTRVVGESVQVDIAAVALP